MIIALSWLIAFIPMLPTSFGAFGRYGLECKTRKCTVINMAYDGNPSILNPKASAGSYTVVLTGVLLVLFNGAIYYRLWVNIILNYAI